MLWIGSSFLLQDGFRKAPTTDLCSIVNQLDTARRFIWNEVTRAKNSKALELKHTIKLICEFDNEIKEIENAIESIMDKTNLPITSIPGIGTNMAAMLIAEIGDFYNFDLSDKILAFAGLSPSTYQSSKPNKLLCTYEEARSPLSALCPFLCNQIRLCLVSYVCLLS